ncbi:MAG: voltage-gated potassium channel [Saprospiraceae bacterium]
MEANQRSPREILHEVIFEADTPKGKRFDIILLIMIVLSVIAVAVETIPNISESAKDFLHLLEWVFTVFFTIEYILRLYTVIKPLKYARSFYGIIDLLAILPAYLSLILAGTHSLVVIRAIRLLRVFRIFKMASFLSQGDIIIKSLKSSLAKIAVFLYFVILMVCIFGAIMYLVEGGTNPSFDSIPRSIYWSIVTLTTVGYGDIVPTTVFGQFLSSILMIVGYAVIAVPTGIVSSELIKGSNNPSALNTQSCRYCSHEGHDDDAEYCKFCGEVLNEEEDD